MYAIKDIGYTHYVIHKHMKRKGEMISGRKENECSINYIIYLYLGEW